VSSAAERRDGILQFIGQLWGLDMVCAIAFAEVLAKQKSFWNRETE